MRDATNLRPACTVSGEAARKRWRVALSAFILVTLAMQARAVFTLTDDYPFASNSMFSFYRSAKTPVYDLYIEVESATGFWRRLDPDPDLGFPSSETFRRLFFGRWYGSTNEMFPQGRFHSDDPAHFNARMAQFFRSVTSSMRVRGQVPIAFRVAVQQLRPSEATALLVGTYSVATGIFTAVQHD